MEYTPQEQHRLTRLDRLLNQYPRRFCWVDLTLLAVYGPRAEAQVHGPRVLHRAAEAGRDCAREAEEKGQCTCGAIKVPELIERRE